MRNLLILLFLAPIILVAQPSINSSILPKINNNLVLTQLKVTSDFSQLDSGENATWDLSELKPVLNDSSSISYLKVPAEYFSKFSKATICAKTQKLSTLYYNMYSVEGGKYHYWGNVTMDTTSHKKIYYDSKIIIRFPFFYPNTLSDDYSYKFISNKDSGLVDGKVLVKAAGYGVLKLPENKIYENTLLIITNDSWIEKGEKYISISYDWYVSGYIGVIVSYKTNYHIIKNKLQEQSSNVFYQINPLKNTEMEMKFTPTK